MKIRTSYVSNSSSSSFCIMGVVLEEDAFNVDEIYNYLDAQKTPLILEYGMEMYPNSYVLGTDIGSMGEEETLKQFRKRTIKELKKLNEKLHLGLDLRKDRVLWRADGGFR